MDVFSRESAPAMLLGGGLALGLLASMWSYVRTLASRAMSYAIVQVRVEDGAAKALTGLCWERYKRSRFGDRRYSSFTDFVQPAGRNREVGYEEPGPVPLVFWNRWRPILISYLSDKGGTSVFTSVVHVSFIRGTFDIEKLVIEALALYNARRHAGSGTETRYALARQHGNRGRPQNGTGYNGQTGESRYAGAPKVTESVTKSPERRILGWESGDIGQPKSSDPYGALAYSDEVEAALADVRRWLASEEWYKQKRIPWRRGYIFSGFPGSGKSSAVRAIAQEHDLPIYSFDLSTFGNADFEDRWKMVLNGAPCIALFEDLDAVFDGRTNSTSTDDDPGLTFDAFLNTIGGVADASGVLVMITTNHPEKLDPAIGTFDKKTGVASRPGRIDRFVNVGFPDERCRRKIVARILSDYPDEIEALVTKTDGMSGAQVTELAAEAALTRYWADTPRKDESCLDCMKPCRTSSSPDCACVPETTLPGS